MFFFFFQAEDGIRDGTVTGVQTCALPICGRSTTWNRLVSRAGVLPGGPNATLHRPPARRSHSASTIQSGASAYSPFWASGSVNASKTTAGAASKRRSSFRSWLTAVLSSSLLVQVALEPVEPALPPVPVALDPLGRVVQVLGPEPALAGASCFSVITRCASSRIRTCFIRPGKVISNGTANSL